MAFGYEFNQWGECPYCGSTLGRFGCDCEGERDEEMDVNQMFEKRLDLSLEPDLEPADPIVPPMSDRDLFDGLCAVAGAIANGDDLQPPTRLRHLHTIEQAIRRLHK